MARKVPWWAKLSGGDGIIKAAKAYNSTPALQNIWKIANQTRLKQDPTLFSAVASSGMPYGEARRLDMAYQAERAAKSSQILKDAGIAPSQMDPRLTSPTQAAEAARQVKIKKERAAADSGWGWLGNVGEAIGDAGNWLWDAGKNALEGLGVALNTVASPIAAPFRAGAAGADPVADAVAKTSFKGTSLEWLLGDDGQGMSNLMQIQQGAERILGTEDVSDPQKIAMRNAGYDPDSWTSRYGYYADITGDNPLVSDRRVSEAKQMFTPEKVDLVREIITSDVLENPARVGSLSDDAQRLYTAIRAGEDKEGSDIFGRLATKNWGTPGAYIADNLIEDETSGWHTAVQVVGDLAAYWYADPLAAAGTGIKALRKARWAVDFEPTAVKDAIINKAAVGKSWDDVLDRVDKIHVLSQSKNLDDQVKAAQEFANFQRSRPDMMPFYETLIGMRQGKITGTFFKEPPRNPTLNDLADFKSNMIGIERVADPAKYKPVFSLRNGIDDAVTDEARTLARAEIADRIGDAILANQVISGKPLIGNKMLMPGQMRLSAPLRNATRVFSDKAFGKSGLLFKQLDEAKGSGIIDFAKADSADAALSGVVDSAKGGEFIRDAYTRGGLRSKAAYALSRFGVSKDAAVLKLDGIDSTKTFHDFVRFLLPRGQSAFLANRWAQADPATRSVMLQNTWEMMANARHGRATRAGDDFWAQALKGRETVVRPGETPREAYSTRDTDLLRTPAGDITAAMYSSQFADGAKLPSFLDIVRNTERVGVISWLAGLANSRVSSIATRITKVGQVGTTSNMLRQTLEARGLQALEDPLGAVRTSLSRMGLAGAHAAERAEANRIVRQAREIMKSGQMEKLTPLQATGKFDEYAALAASVTKKQLEPGLSKLLSEGALIQDISSARGAIRLAATKYGGVDLVRRKRAKLYAKATDDLDVDHAYDWMEKVDTEYAEKALNAAHKMLGGNRAHYMDGGLADEMEQIDDGLRAGQRLATVKLSNTQGYLGAGGDSGALRWANALGIRAADPAGGVLLRAAARDELARRGLAPKKFAKDEDLEALVKAAGSTDPGAIASQLLIKDPRGETYRLNGRRAQYVDGKFVSDPANRDLALEIWAADMTKDARHYLGFTRDAMLEEGGKLSKEYVNFLRKVADGKPFDAEDLAKISDEFRPRQVHAPVIVGKKFVESSEGMSEKVAKGATKWYDFVVARPLQRLVNEPQVAAAHREVMDALEPLAKALADRGMSHQSIYNILQTGAYGHAISRVNRYSDNPHVQSYFAALSNNFLWYERAMEDFARRAMNIAKADPAIIARSALLIEAGVHSGLIDKQISTDDDGTPETQYVFTWPGSGLMMRAVNEGLQALGVADSVKIPVWQDFTSPVKYLSPSLQNPLGFTTTPLIGLPMRVIKDVFPETAPSIDSVLTTLEGGERSFGSQGYIESLLPVYAKRAWNALNEDDRDGQFASAFRNALVYYQAAGKLPGPEATAGDRQRAMDDIATMVQNNLTLRAIFGTFAPATPGTMGSNISGIGDDELNVIDRARGVTTIRGEWFQLLEEMSKRNPDSQKAYSEAAAEWMKRGHKSILNPEAFTVGTSGAPGEKTGRSFGSSQELTQWMLSNREYVKQYGDVAYALLPETAGPYYDQIGYRLQLKNELRQHKTGQEFYDAMVYAMADRDFYSALDARDEAIRTGQDEKRAKKWFSAYTANLEAANPVWASERGVKASPEYIAKNVAPAVAKLAEDPKAPAEIKRFQRELKLLSGLYDEYHAARTKAANNRSKLVSLSIQYGKRGDELFKGGPISNLWSRMRVWED